MDINIGSQNEVKVMALKEVIANYEILKNAAVHPMNAPSGVSEQPKSLEETITGAMNRARGAYKNCRLSFGVESGLMKVPHSKSGYMDMCACVIFDGQEFHLGISSAFEFPSAVTKLIFSEGLDANEAFYRAGFTKNPKLGNAEGAIGLLTRGRVTRKDYTKQAIVNALIHIENGPALG